MTSNSQITIVVVDSKLIRTVKTYRLAYITGGKSEVSLALSQITPKGENVLGVTSLDTNQKADPVTQDLCNPRAAYRHQLMSLMITYIIDNYKKANSIDIAVETDNRYEIFRMYKLRAISLQTLEVYVLPKALRMLGENLLDPKAVSQSYLRTDYEVSYTVHKGERAGWAHRHFLLST